MWGADGDLGGASCSPGWRDGATGRPFTSSPLDELIEGR